jgi:hypothetical protein
MLKRVLAAGIALLAMLAMGSASAFASSHREAPLISADPQADLNDLYAWRDFADPTKLNFAITAYPLEEPGDAPNYYGFGDNVRYDLNIDKNGDARPDITYRLRFTTHHRNGSVFVYNLPGATVTSLTDPDLLVYQTYSLQRINWGRSGRIASSHMLVTSGHVVPNNVGQNSMPNYSSLMAAGVTPIAGGAKVWTGQADDPFFLDLGAIGDSVHVRNPGFDTLGGYNAQGIALQVPISAVTSTGHPTIGIWADTQRQQGTNLLNGRGSGQWVQIERLGMPLTNEVLIGLDDKDHWNAVRPTGDAQFSHYLLNPVLAAVLGAPATHRTDILATFDKGLAPVNNVTGGPLADELRLNTTAPPTAPGSQNRLGALGGDADGFPNGRRLRDDTVDIELQVVAGALIGHPNSVGDSVNGNDVAFGSSFPYLAKPHSGFQVAGHNFAF